MVKLVIDDLDEELLNRLERQAQARSQTVAELARDLLGRAMPARSEVSTELARIRAMIPPGDQEDSVAIIRRLRDG
jgi:DNA-binding Lrp family transcriptional regulator